MRIVWHRNNEKTSSAPEILPSPFFRWGISCNTHLPLYQLYRFQREAASNKFSLIGQGFGHCHNVQPGTALNYGKEVAAMKIQEKAYGVCRKPFRAEISGLVLIINSVGVLIL